MTNARLVRTNSLAGLQHAAQSSLWFYVNIDTAFAFHVKTMKRAWVTQKKKRGGESVAGAQHIVSMRLTLGLAHGRIYRSLLEGAAV